MKGLVYGSWSGTNRHGTRTLDWPSIDPGIALPYTTFWGKRNRLKTWRPTSNMKGKSMTCENKAVAIVHVYEQDTHAALKHAVALIGGMGDIAPPGSSILVKPNMVMGPTERGITNPVVLEAVLRLASATAPKRLIVAEGSADCYTPSVFRNYNVYGIASRYGAEVVDLNQDEGVRTPVPRETGREAVMLPKSMAEADVVISVPMFKLWMGKLPMSLSLKNLFGSYGARYYGHNKHSHELADSTPRRTLYGEIGSERGIHTPSVEQSIAAINLARTSDLTVVDALEGSDGKGNFVRMDMLMVGRNAVATDSVALAVAGFVPEEQEQIRLCSQMGLGPCRLDEIEVLGVTVEQAHFLLNRLNENVLELPMAYCLERLCLGEFAILANGLKLHGFLDEDATLGNVRVEVTEALLAVLTEPDYLGRAVASLPETGVEMLERIVKQGGTSGNYFDLLNERFACCGSSKGLGLLFTQ